MIIFFLCTCKIENRYLFEYTFQNKYRLIFGRPISKWYFPIPNHFFQLGVPTCCRLDVGSIILDEKRKIASELTEHMKLCTTFIIWIFKVEQPRDRTSEFNSHTKRKSLEMQLKMAISHICDKVMMMMMIRWETVKETENHTENKTYKRITYTHLTWHKKTCKRTQRWLTPKPNLNGRVFFLSLHNTSAFFVAPFSFCLFFHWISSFVRSLDNGNGQCYHHFLVLCDSV